MRARLGGLASLMTIVALTTGALFTFFGSCSTKRATMEQPIIYGAANSTSVGYGEPCIIDGNGKLTCAEATPTPTPESIIFGGGATTSGPAFYQTNLGLSLAISSEQVETVSCECLRAFMRSFIAHGDQGKVSEAIAACPELVGR